MMDTVDLEGVYKCGSVVVIAFQSSFRSEMYQNNIFFIFKKLFLILAYQNDMKK